MHNRAGPLPKGRKNIVYHGTLLPAGNHIDFESPETCPGRSRTYTSAETPGFTHPLATSVLYGVWITKKMTLSALYKYPQDTDIEYPETSEAGVGHLFQLHWSPETSWENPTLSFVYSQGAPRGYTLLGREVDVDILGNGSSSDIFKKTAALVTALRRLGCTASLNELTVFDDDEQEVVNQMILHREQNRRGYTPSEETCDGRLYLDYDYHTNRPSIRCEHYSSNTRDHLIFTSIADGSYDMGYLEAIFTEDTEEIKHIEYSAFALGFGPLVECSTVCNFSVQKTLCPFDHRDTNNILIQHPMVHLPCQCTFRIYEPIEEYRDDFPFILVVSKGVHPHPIPLPTKTPPKIRSEVLELLPHFQEDLPDLTPRRFLRHPIVKAYLVLQFPKIQNPMLSDLHISLANRITCPLVSLLAFLACTSLYKLRQAPASKLLKGRCNHISRCILTKSERNYTPMVPGGKTSTIGEWWTLTLRDLNRILKMILWLCLTANDSDSLSYVQSDIGFKRVVGFYEFELGGWERDASTCKPPLLTSKYFKQLKTLYMQIRVDIYVGAIFMVQTLMTLTISFCNGWVISMEGKPKFHRTWAASASPGTEVCRERRSSRPYPNIRKPYTLRASSPLFSFINIRKCKAPEKVKELMQSLICMEHLDWDGTIQAIRDLGGKLRHSDWVHDKERSQFVFQAMCWAKSSMPRLVWRAGERTSNLIETTHSDINREGVQCTILGGVLKGEFYDSLQMKTLVFEKTGIRSGYSTGHPAENAVRGPFDPHHHCGQISHAAWMGAPHWTMRVTPDGSPESGQDV
ncbi:hypothetical protein B0H10DRAFT_2368910 [Mycena sp. CBHHK59/15]|nr:hypothetical protein B0H10DRAFT_2368910 [Mycena sp. CBHHK59/15]